MKIEMTIELDVNPEVDIDFEQLVVALLEADENIYTVIVK